MTELRNDCVIHCVIETRILLIFRSKKAGCRLQKPNQRKISVKNLRLSNQKIDRRGKPSHSKTHICQVFE